jgi:hypothetical protein
MHVVAMSVIAVLCACSVGCGDTGDVGAAGPAPSDAGDTPTSILDSNLPQIGVVVVGDTGDVEDIGPDGADADVYELAPNSITTCGQFFECIQDCRADYDSCAGPCNDAMTNAAATTVHRLMNCIARNRCRSGGCITQSCGQEAQACFSSPY